VVKAICPQGGELRARALLDQRSELSFVCESLAQSLRLKRRSSSIRLIGIGARKSICAQGVVRLIVKPHFSSTESFEVCAHVLPQITNQIPSEQVDQQHWSHLADLQLADPTFSTPSRIDILLGADIYGYLLCNDVIRGRDAEPVAQLTSLGWIVSGSASAKIQPKRPYPLIGQCAAQQHLHTDRELHNVVHKFWSQDSVPPHEGGHLTEAERHCEVHFRSTHTRDSTGRYMVRLPFKTRASLGTSKPCAARMLENLQRKFHQNPTFHQLYAEFLSEYESLGHMRRIPGDDTNSNNCYYLPHHGVLRESNTTTKFRVVFNGSQKTREGLSLNDVLQSGRKIQQHLDAVILRWRVFRYSSQVISRRCINRYLFTRTTEDTNESSGTGLAMLPKLRQKSVILIVLFVE